MRRLVTGVDENGRSVVASDDDVAPHRFEHIPGMEATMLWATHPGPVDRSGVDPVPSLEHDVPRLGETRFHLIQLPPDEVYEATGFRPEMAQAEQNRMSPELSRLFEPDSPGTHTMETTDYVFVVTGSIALEVDQGAPAMLHAGDVVVMNGARHAWRNRSGAPCALLVVWVAPTPQA